MLHNPAVQNHAKLAWDGATALPIDLSTHINFGFQIETTGLIAVAAVFKVQAAPASLADPCLPGVFVDVDEMATCNGPVVPGAKMEFTIPAGTPIGQVCSVGIPCRPNKFIKLVSVSGDVANVDIFGIMQGPRP